MSTFIKYQHDCWSHTESRVRCIEVFEKEARVFCAHSARKPRSQVIAHARPAHDVAPHAVTHALAPHGLMLLLRRTTSPATPGGVFCACGALVSGTISLPPTPGDVHLREEGLGARGVRCMRLVRCVVLLRCHASWSTCETLAVQASDDRLPSP